MPDTTGPIGWIRKKVSDDTLFAAGGGVLAGLVFGAAGALWSGSIGGILPVLRSATGAFSVAILAVVGLIGAGTAVVIGDMLGELPGMLVAGVTLGFVSGAASGAITSSFLWGPAVGVALALIAIWLTRTNIPVLVKRECSAYFYSPIFYVIAVLYLFLSGFLFYRDIALAPNPLAQLGSPMGVLIFLLWFLGPVITMRQFAEERRSGSMEVLMTAPVSDAEVVVGKYLGSMVVFGAILLPTVIYVGALFAVSNQGPDMGPLLGMYLGVVLLAGLFIAIGLFASALTRDQIVSAIAGSVMCFGFMILYLLEDSELVRENETLRSLLNFVSFGRQMQPFAKGLMDTRSLVYFLSFTVFVLFLTVKAVEGRKWIGSSGGGARGEGGRTVFRTLRYAGFYVFFGNVLLSLLKVYPSQGPLAISIAVASLLAIAVGAAFDWRSVYNAVVNRRFAVGANVAFSVLLALVLLFMVNWMSNRHYVRKDMTSRQMFSLDKRTKYWLDQLDDELEVTTLLVPPPAHGGADIRGRVGSLLEEYTAYQPLMKVRHIDPRRDSEAMREIFEEMGLGSFKLNSILLRYKGGTPRELSREDLVEEPPPQPWGGPPTGPVRFLGEDAVTSALRSLLKPRDIKVYFLTGHREKRPDFSAGGLGLGAFSDELKRHNFEVAELNILEERGIPEDCAVLVVPGPKDPFDEKELAEISGYLQQRGGKLIVMLDSIHEADVGMSSVESVLEDWGVRVRTDLVGQFIEKRLFIGFSQYGISRQVSVGPDLLSPHEVTDPSITRRMPCLFPGVAPILVKEPKDKDYDAKVLVKSADAVWGEASFGGRQSQELSPTKDISGPIGLLAAVWKKGGGIEESEEETGEEKEETGIPAGTRIAVFGDSDFVSDGYVERHPANIALTLDTLYWMVGREENIGIPTRRQDIRSAMVTEVGKARLFWGCAVLPPVAVFILGLLVAWRRRR